MTRTLLLDLDGTLVDTVPDIAAALNRLMTARSLPVFTRDDVKAMIGDGVAALVSRAFAAHENLPDSAALTDFVSDYEAHVAAESQLFPNVQHALGRLADHGWNLAVCTNKPEHAARSLLDALGILGLMQAVGGGDSFPVRKPDPAHLLATLMMAAGTPEQAVMLGDHRNDVLAAAGAGIPCIFAGWGYGAPGMADGSAAVAADIMQAVDIAAGLLPRPD